MVGYLKIIESSIVAGNMLVVWGPQWIGEHPHFSITFPLLFFLFSFIIFFLVSFSVFLSTLHLLLLHCFVVLETTCRHRHDDLELQAIIIKMQNNDTTLLTNDVVIQMNSILVQVNSSDIV